MINVTEEMVVGLWNHLEYHYKSRRLNKAHSQDMDLISRFLEQTGIVDADVFMTQYTTTIEDVIYMPFYVGDTDSYSLEDQLHVCCHEHQHVVQWRKKRGLFLLEYVTDSDRRAHYEAEAMQVNLELDYWLGRPMRDIDAWTAHLKEYSLNNDHIATVTKSLKIACKSIYKGGISTNVGKYSIGWLNDHAKKEKLFINNQKNG